jgi:hypothetical protein
MNNEIDITGAINARLREIDRTAANRVKPGSRPGKRLMNIDGINYHTIAELAEARGCSIARIRQILAEAKIEPRLKLASLYTDTQAAIVRDHHSDGPAGRPAMLTAYDILREIAHSRQLARPSGMFGGDVHRVYQWCEHARTFCPIKTRGYIKQMVNPFLETPMERLPAWRRADHDAILEWAIADLPAI